MIAAELQWHVAKDPQAGVAADHGTGTTAGLIDPRFHFAEIQPGHHGDVEGHMATQSMDDTDELPPRMQFPPNAHGEEVDHARFAGTGSESRDQHEAVAAIFALYPVPAHRGNGEVTALAPVEQATETTVGVEAGQAAPIDGTAA